MLRMQFMPSDFDPQLLILGDKSDIAAFADILSQFSATGTPTSLNDSGIFSENTTAVLQELGRQADAHLGLWPEPTGIVGEHELVWTLTRDHAKKFENDVRKVADGTKLSGSTVLEVEALNEIRAHVSIGEFEDNFLLGHAR